jgi:hypothetical protein
MGHTESVQHAPEVRPTWQPTGHLPERGRAVMGQVDRVHCPPEDRPARQTTVHLPERGRAVMGQVEMCLRPGGRAVTHN